MTSNPTSGTDTRLFALIKRAQAGDDKACEQLLTENTGLLWSITRRFFGRGQDAEDLYQLACLGFLKAIRGFDFRFGTQLSTYAVPKIVGEIRRFLRDDGALKVSRDLKERARQVFAVRSRLEASTGEIPTISALSEATGYSIEDLAACDTVLLPPESLDKPLDNVEDGATLGGMLGEESFEESWLEREVVREAVKRLEKQEHMVILLRFYRGFTQERTARVIGVSQVQVSRLERRAVAHLRALV